MLSHDLEQLFLRPQTKPTPLNLTTPIPEPLRQDKTRRTLSITWQHHGRIFTPASPRVESSCRRYSHSDAAFCRTNFES